MTGKRPILVIGINDKRCKKNLDLLKKSIVTKRYASTATVNRWLGKMERTYNTYRLANLKYLDTLNPVYGMSHGVRDHYRECLRDIVLNNGVQNENKETAIKLLLSDRANKELYSLLRAQDARQKNGNNDKQNNKLLIDESLIKLILKFFPKHCDQDLMNIASYFAMHAYNDLAIMAIKKIESPRVLLAVCTSFRDDFNTLTCTGVAIECLGEKIEHSCNAINAYNDKQSESENKIEYWNSDLYKPTNRASWQHSDPNIDHELSMIFSAHVALRNVVVEYGNKNDISLTSTSDKLQYEQKLYVKALNNIVIAGFIESIFPRIISDDSEKVQACAERLMDLSDSNTALQQIIMHKNLPPTMLCDAINKIKNTINDPCNTKTRATLKDYIDDEKMHRSIRKTACEAVNGDHDYQPNNGGGDVSKYLVCSQCGATTECKNPRMM